MITSVTQQPARNVVLVTATSDLTAPVYFFWYLDGIYVGVSQDGTWTFVLSAGDQSRVDVLDSTDPAFDTAANAPTQYPARRTLVFVRTLDATVNKYRVEQQKNAGSWTTIATVPDDPSQWEFEVITPRLDDLSSYAWRVTPLDIAGNAGTPLALTSELIVRNPDSPRFSATFHAGALTITFAAA